MQYFTSVIPFQSLRSSLTSRNADGYDVELNRQTQQRLSAFGATSSSTPIVRETGLTSTSPDIPASTAITPAVQKLWNDPTSPFAISDDMTRYRVVSYSYGACRHQPTTKHNYHQAFRCPFSSSSRTATHIPRHGHRPRGHSSHATFSATFSATI